MKIIAVDKGFYIPGGTQLYGKFLTLKRCMKACALAPSCFSADYNPWLRKCYQHSNYTACNTRKSHSQFVHFSKVPCSKFSSAAAAADDDDDDDDDDDRDNDAFKVLLHRSNNKDTFNHNCSVRSIRTFRLRKSPETFMELYNMIELYVFRKKTSYIGLQAHNSTTAIAAIHCYTRQEV